ncbi:MAG: rod shape-determining protein MreC [Bacilli bacterium]|nr:rod shape-determining protein MreC [Bacilli bacterium]
MGKLILGDNMKNKVLYLIFFLFVMSYIELNDDSRFGGILRDIIYKPIVIENNALIDNLNEEVKKENEELKRMLKVSSLTDFEIVYATVVERNMTYFLNELTINKGANDGLKKNMIVVTNEGVVGKIKDVNENTSKVKLLTSDSDIMQVRINNKNMIMKSKNNKLIIKANKEDKIKIGDKVITSGLLDKTPQGVLIGIVDNINYENVGLSLEIKMAAHTDDLRFVAVLKRKDN